MTVVPQQYKLQCFLSGIKRNFRWYYVYNSQSSSIEFNCLTQNFGYSCSNESQIIYRINNTIVRNLTVTWYAEKMNSGIFSQSNNNGDHVHRCYEKVNQITRNRYLTVTGKYFYYYSHMMLYIILSAPGFTPSPPTLVNKTATTITVSWTPVPSDADGYVVNATSDTHTMTQQVKGGSQNKIILKGLIPVTTYNITVRAYQDILGPASNVISVQTFHSVPGPVSTLSSLMSTTWAVISWSVPSYIPVDYPIITYEIGYTTHQSNGSCSPSDEFNPMIKTNTCSRSVKINDLIGNSCYLFGVRGYTVNGYGLWTVIGNQTLSELHTTGIFNNY